MSGGKENIEKINQAIAILQTIVDNATIPRNIRKSVRNVIDMLKDNSLSPAVRAANAITALEEVAQDPNIPSYARVTLWNAFSFLEAVREVS